MPRDVNGTFTLVAGNPVVSGTPVSSTWANNTLSDIADSITDSLSRNGDGGMLVPFELSDGTVGLPSLTFSTENTLGLYRPSAGILGFAIGGVQVATAVAGGLTARAFVPSASTVPTNGMYLSAANTVAFASNTTLRGSVNSTGNWVLAAPSSGTTLTLPNTASAIALSGASLNIGIGTAFVAAQSEIYTASTVALGIGTAGAAALNLYTNSTNRIAIASAGNVVVSAPSAGIAQTVNLLAGQLGLSVEGDMSSNFGFQLSSSAVTTGRTAMLFARTGGTAKSWAIGIDADGGTDNSFDIRDITRNEIMFSISSAGACFVTDAGTQREVGYRSLPYRSFSASDNTAASDNGKAVRYTGSGGHTFTVDSDFTDGMLITIINATANTLSIAESLSGSLIWIGGAAATGTRTLAAYSVCTIMGIGGTDAYIWGTGIT